MKRISLALITGTFVAGLFACGNQASTTTAKKEDSTMNETSAVSASIKEEPVSYTAGNTSLKGYVAYDEKKQGPRPVVLVVPEWWGMTDYPRMRAKMLAEMGYLAMAVDMYGDGKIAPNPDEAQKSAMPFYQNPQMAKERLDAALAKVRSMPQADTAKTIAIGYCFGGSMVLNYAKMGAPVLGVVSFHGGLQGVPPHKGTKAQFLVCHGGADSFVPQDQVNAFRKSMDSAGVAYDFKVYEGATHAFTNPDATEKGKQFNMPIRYNGAADTASWNDMKAFFGKILK
ncbi:dienelactone hydrolase family protein [Flavisolibacter nicotianae]|uniref:dienelactone hydrolase family protein n=1 Tax=Flavisolibacter nicotianae TaxID=2364882 RepID=UPI000EB2ED1C|nr:dienelactone hydrolase family protein [Flavisolibacter nicotianae]